MALTLLKKSTMNSTISENRDENRRILVVDDEPEVRDLIQLFLVPEGISCLMAGSVAEACSQLNNIKFPMVLLDWRLDRSGIEVLRFCRAKLPHMPVIVMSAMAQGVFDIESDALVAGADSFLEKPFNRPALVAHIKRWFDRVDAASNSVWPTSKLDIIPLELMRMAYIRHVVKLLDNNVSQAAEKLGIHRQTIASLIKNHQNMDSAEASN